MANYGVMRFMRDEFAVEQESPWTVTIGTGFAVLANGQTWPADSKQSLDVPAGDDWYTVALVGRRFGDDYIIEPKVLRGISYDYDQNKVPLATVRTIGHKMIVEDRRRFMEWRA